MSTKFAFVLFTVSLSVVAVTEATNKAAFTTNVENCVANLRRVNCMVTTVSHLNNAADEYSYKLKYECGAGTTYQTQITNVYSLMAQTTAVTKVNDGVCGNSKFVDSLNGNTVPDATCTTPLKTEMDTLFTKYDTTNTEVDTAYAATTTPFCPKRLMFNFKRVLGAFESHIEYCGTIV